LGEAWKALPRETRKRLGKELVKGLKGHGWLKVKGFGLNPSHQRATKINFGDKLHWGHHRAPSLTEYLTGDVVVKEPTLRFGGWDSLLPAIEAVETTRFPISIK
jgi:hypothetical protein